MKLRIGLAIWVAVLAWVMTMGPAVAKKPTTLEFKQPTVKCHDAVKGLVWYRGKYVYWRKLRGLNDVPNFQRGKSCPHVRFLADRWRQRARAQRKAYEKWYAYHWAWRTWLPGVWYNIGSCETGYGGDPNWRHNSGTYQGAFGFHYASWDQFRPANFPSEAYLATPRQQLIVAQAIEARFGLDEPWGCYP